MGHLPFSVAKIFNFIVYKQWIIKKQIKKNTIITIGFKNYLIIILL